jgi:hypothetical protein
MPVPLCFMIMPYCRKRIQSEAGKGPSETNFNALWDKASLVRSKKVLQFSLANFEWTTVSEVPEGH